MSAHPSDRLSAYIDGDLKSEERVAVEAHLRTCSACLRELDELRVIVDHAAGLRPARPPRDLWPGIAERIEARPIVASSYRKWWSVAMPQLAAAAMVVIVLSLAVAWWSQQDSRSGADSEGTPTLTVAESAGDTGLAEYATAMGDLEQLIAENREALDPETVAIIEANIETVDGALREIVEALRDDPNSPYLIEHLAERRQQRLDLLRQATHVIQASL